MARKSRKLTKKGGKTRKQRIYKMKGCAKSKKIMSLGKGKNTRCSKCDSNCQCGPNCNCSHKCPGNCYLKNKGGSGCGPYGCPIAPLSWKDMQSGGSCSTCNVMQGGPILGIGQNGGNGIARCGGQIQVVPNKMGGGFYKPASNIPGPFVGSPWKPNVWGWPGVDGIGGDRNYLEENMYHVDPQTMMKLGGTKKAKKTTTSSSSSSSLGSSSSSLGSSSSTLGSSSSTSSSPMTSSSSSSSSSSSGSSVSATTSSPTYSSGGGLIPQDLVNLGSDFSYNFKTAYNALNGYPAPVDPTVYKGQFPQTLNNSKVIV